MFVLLNRKGLEASLCGSERGNAECVSKAVYCPKRAMVRLLLGEQQVIMIGHQTISKQIDLELVERLTRESSRRLRSRLACGRSGLGGGHG